MQSELCGRVRERETEAIAAWRRRILFTSGFAVEGGGLEARGGGQKVSEGAAAVAGEGEGPPARVALGEEGVGGDRVGGPGMGVGADARDRRGGLVAGPGCGRR